MAAERSPGPRTVRYGGNTPCVELRTSEDWLVILDAGTGIRELGRSLLERNIVRQQEGMPGRHELKFMRSDGSALWVHLAANALFFDTRTPEGSARLTRSGASGPSR